MHDHLRRPLPSSLLRLARRLPGVRHHHARGRPHLPSRALLVSRPTYHYGGGQRNGRQRGRGGHGAPTAPTGGSPPGLHPSFTHPWAGTVHMWPYDRSDRPLQAPPEFAAYHTMAATTVASTAAPTAASTALPRMVRNTGELHHHHHQPSRGPRQSCRLHRRHPSRPR